MKRGRKLTRDMKIGLDKLGLNPAEYEHLYTLAHSYILRNKSTGETVVLER